MSAIVTGQKTRNGVVSQSAAAVRGEKDGDVLQTILEHAEQRGLSTGVITNMNVADATPAACYAHSNNRGNTGQIFAQLAKPRFGDGPDIVVGAGRSRVLSATKDLGMDIEGMLRKQGYVVLDSPGGVKPDAKRVVALTDNPEFDPAPVLESAIRMLSRNEKGYFLMLEWDMHTNQLEDGLNRALTMDSLVRSATSQATDDTLVIFTADHSFDLRVRGGRRDEPLLEQPAELSASEDAPKAAAARQAQAQPKPQPAPAAKPAAPATPALGNANVRVDNAHTGEQVLVSAQGPGAERVRGYILNTDLFRIMMAAYGWGN
jgi:alkaline phosphatase